MKPKLRSVIDVSSAKSLAFVRSSLLLRTLALGLTCGLLLTSRALAADDGDSFKVNIRTEVEREWTLFSKKPAVVHSKVYSLAWVRNAKIVSQLDLISPVDVNALLHEVHDVLASRGFHQPEPGKVPDILLTILFGRSTLKNPYDDGAMPVADAGLGNGTLGPTGPSGGGNLPGTTSSASAGSTEQVVGGMDLAMAIRTPGYMEKKVAAEGEKVFISVTAWEFPGFAAKGKPKMLWRTTMVVDDPAMDLNEIGGKMLALGAPYFDREISEKEITVTGTLADATPPKSSLSDTDNGAGKSIK